MHDRLFIDAHQDQRWLKGNGAKGIGSHPVLGTAMMGGHHRHAGRKAAKHLPKKHRIKWHNSSPGNCRTLSPTYCVPQLAPPVWRGYCARVLHTANSPPPVWRGIISPTQ